ncbi:MAG: ABC transporter permease [Steroidobacteraceae bacterium]
MSLDIRPVVSSLLRNRTGAVLVAFQIAIALAVLVNAVFIVHQRIEKVGRPTHVDDQNLFGVAIGEFTARFNFDASLQEDLAYMRSLPGVISASVSNSIPLGISGSATTVFTLPDAKGNRAQINFFSMDEQGLKTLGVRLLAGREFRATEILPPITPQNIADFVPQVIVTKVVAEKLFPHENALGKTVYDGRGKPATIIGIMDNMIGTGWSGYEGIDQVAIFPQLPRLYGFAYLVRTEPGRRDAIMRTVEDHLSSNPNRVIKFVRSVEHFKKILYRDDRNMEIFLITVTVLLLAIASLGIFGLATFNVSARTKQIGTRRAVGARRGDIVRYFMVENGLITTTGIVVGCALALAIGYWLSLQYQLPRLELYYLVGGVLALWIIGQLAAWQPARRASAVSPSVATRTV